MKEIDERYKPEWRDFDKRFREAMDHALVKLEGLPPDVGARTEDQIRERYRRYEKEEYELEKREPDFYDPKTQGKHMSLSEFVHFDADQIADRAVAKQHGKDNPEFEKSWRDRAIFTLEKLQGLPRDACVRAEDQIRAYYLKFDNERAALAKKESGLDDPATQKLNQLSDWTANKAVEQERAKDLAGQLKAREATAGHDRDRER